MSPLDIRIELLKLKQRTGVSQAAIARAAGVKHRSHVSLTIDRKTYSKRVRRAIAQAIGMTYERVWGEPDPDVKE
jgi:lambda repressor-like predicted transcriptional regulator